jgi:hypothetical protein
MVLMGSCDSPEPVVPPAPVDGLVPGHLIGGRDGLEGRGSGATHHVEERPDDETPSAPGEVDADDHGFLTENFINFGTLEFRTKVLVATSIVVLLAAAAVIAAVSIGGFLRPAVGVAVSQYGVLGTATGTISQPVVVAVDVALAAVFIMLMTGTMHSRSDAVFLAGPLAFGFFAIGFMTLADWLVLGPPVFVAEFICYQLWAGEGALSGFLRARAKSAGHGGLERPLPAGAVTVVALCVAAFFALGLWKLGYSQMTTLMILRVRIGIEWLLLPVLILVGTDFGEAADAVSAVVVAHLARHISKAALLWVVIAAGLAGLLIANAAVASGRWFLFLLPFAALVTATQDRGQVRRSGACPTSTP